MHCNKDYINQYEYSFHTTANEEAWSLVSEWTCKSVTDRGYSPNLNSKIQKNMTFLTVTFCPEFPSTISSPTIQAFQSLANCFPPQGRMATYFVLVIDRSQNIHLLLSKIFFAKNSLYKWKFIEQKIFISSKYKVEIFCISPLHSAIHVITIKKLRLTFRNIINQTHLYYNPSCVVLCLSPINVPLMSVTLLQLIFLIIQSSCHTTQDGSIITTKDYKPRFSECGRLKFFSQVKPSTISVNQDSRQYFWHYLYSVVRIHPSEKSKLIRSQSRATSV